MTYDPFGYAAIAVSVFAVTAFVLWKYLFPPEEPPDEGW